MVLPLNTIIIILFYAGIFVLIYAFRKKFAFQKVGKIPIIAILRTNFGIKFINKIAKKHSKFFKILGYIGMIIGFLGIIAMTFMISSSFVKLFTEPSAPSGVSPVIPGVKIPGAQIFVPFWYGIISLFIVVVVHEFGHGIVAKAHGFKIKNTGLVLFAILPGAFVEPDEKKLVKAKKLQQQSVYAAGPWFNILLSAVAFLLIILVISPIHSDLYNSKGFAFESTDNNSPAMQANMPVNTTYNRIDDTEVYSFTDMANVLEDKQPGDQIIFYTEANETYPIILAQHPEDNSSAYIGIMNIINVQGEQTFIQKIAFTIVDIIASLLYWVFLLSMGIGAANLLPIGPLDGGRMLYTSLKGKFKERKAKLITTKVTVLVVVFLLSALLVPIIKAII